jgi:hypothetical protein
MRACLSAFVAMMLFPASVAGQQLVYAITQFNQVAAIAQKTDVYLIRGDGSAARKVFTDEGTPFVLMPVARQDGMASQVMVISSNKMIAPGMERGRPVPNQLQPTAMYEASLDGSNRIRKLFDVKVEQRVDAMAVTRSGEKIAYLDWENGRRVAFVRRLNGTMLHKIDITHLVGECFVNAIGWMRDDDHLFFNAMSGPDGEDDQLSGTWIVREDGSQPRRLLDARQHPGGLGWLLGELSTGQLLYMGGKEEQIGRRRVYRTSLSVADKDLSRVREYPMETGEWMVLSPDGSAVAYTRQAAIEFLAGKINNRPEHVWVKVLPGGAAKEWFSVPDPRDGKGYLELVGWIEQ